MKMKRLLALTLAAGAVAAPVAITTVNHQEQQNTIQVEDQPETAPVNGDDGLTDWAITGIAVSSAIVAMGIGYGIWYWYKKSKKD